MNKIAICLFSKLIASEIAAFQKHRIRECSIRLARLNNNDIANASSKKKLFLKKTNIDVSANVSWIPTASSYVTVNHSAVALPSLRKNIRRQRAKSMFVDRPVQPHEDEKNITLDDMLMEFRKRYNSFNRGLKPSSDRRMPPPPSKPLTPCEKIFNEMKVKLAAKRNAQKPKI